MDRPVALRITKFLRERVAHLEDPRSIGEALKGSQLGGLWKYRVGDWRIICEIKDAEIVITVLTLGNRREIYR
jgi:mRNA interferase RelE/StbE